MVENDANVYFIINLIYLLFHIIKAKYKVPFLIKTFSLWSSNVYEKQVFEVVQMINIKYHFIYVPIIDFFDCMNKFDWFFGIILFWKVPFGRRTKKSYDLSQF